MSDTNENTTKLNDKQIAFLNKHSSVLEISKRNKTARRCHIRHLRELRSFDRSFDNYGL
jgi:hypothetical protein